MSERLNVNFIFSRIFFFLSYSVIVPENPSARKRLSLTIENVKLLEDELAANEGEDLRVEKESDSSSNTNEIDSESVTESGDSDVDWDLSVRKATPREIQALKRERKAKRRDDKIRSRRRKKGLPSNSSYTEEEIQEDEEADKPDGPLQIFRKKFMKAKQEFLARLFETGFQL